MDSKQIDREENKEKIKREIKKKAVELTKYIAKRSFTFILKDKLGIDADELINIVADKTNKNISKNDANEIMSIISSKDKEDESIFMEYDEYQKTKGIFKELLIKLSGNEKVIFIIDELDRCNPLYAIDMLETMKHFFCINNIVYQNLKITII